MSLLIFKSSRPTIILLFWDDLCTYLILIYPIQIVLFIKLSLNLRAKPKDFEWYPKTINAILIWIK